MKLRLAGLSMLLLFTVATRAQEAPPLPDGIYAEVTTPRGVIVGQLHYKQVPMTVASYVGLAEGTLGPEPRHPYFDRSTFHRVVPGFVAQGGAAMPGGRGGPGYQFPDEIVPGLRHDSLGVMQMANSGPDTNGSQWCFMLGESQRLNYNHTVFGRVVRGADVLPKIEQGDSMKVRILRIGDDAKAFKADDAAFNGMLEKAKRYQGPKEPGENAFFDDAERLLPSEWSRAAVFNYKLANLERFTGVRVAARLLAKTPPNQSAETYLAELAEKMKIGNSGAAVVYVADTDTWHFRFGDKAQASFIEGPRKADGTKENRPARPIDVAVKEFLDAARAQSTSAIAAAGQATTTQPVASSQKIKLQVDAVLDNLIFRLEPAALPR